MEVTYLEPADLRATPMPEEFTAGRLRRSLLILAGVIVLLIAAITSVSGLSALREQLAGAEPALLVAAAALQVLSCVSYVVAFRTVFCRRMSWRTSAEIGFAELAANSVLSVGGAGGLALGAWILGRGGVAPGHIARRTVAFFLLTSFANVTLLALVGLALAIGLLSGSTSLPLTLIPAIVGLLAIGLALAAQPAAHALADRARGAKLERALHTLGDGVSEALLLLRTHQPALALGTAGYVLFDVAMLGVCFAAFGNDVPPAGVLLLAYLIGQLGGLIPVPGGIGGVDAGLIGTLILYGVDPAAAGVAVIAYRALLLSVPVLLGLPALAVLRKRLQSEAHDIAACGPGQEVEVLGRGAVMGWGPAPRTEG